MVETSPERWDETPTVEVRILRRGELVRTELCESEEQAALAVEAWADVAGVRCEVGDISAHDAADRFESEAAELRLEDAYPTEIERSVGVIGE